MKKILTFFRFINAIADEIKQRKDDIVRIEIMDNGKPLQEAKNDVDDTIACFQYYANQAVELDKKQDQPIQVADSRFKISVRYEAVGVTGLIIPWNYPLLMAAWKVAPLLAAGATGVLKPSELTPLSALELAAICKKVGLPAGVLNVITGTLLFERNEYLIQSEQPINTKRKRKRGRKKMEGTTIVVPSSFFRPLFHF